jgi:hypothetical protein
MPDEQRLIAEDVAAEGVVEGWYSDRFGFHQHPEEWPLNITRRAHQRCRRAWVEDGYTECPVCFCPWAVGETPVHQEGCTDG